MRWLLRKLGYLHISEVEAIASTCSTLSYRAGWYHCLAENETTTGQQHPYGTNTDRWLPPASRN